MLPIFLVHSLAALTEGPEVRLSLYTRSPNVLTAVNDFKAGYEAAGKNEPQRGPTGILPVTYTGFDLAIDARQPLLRYNEPNAWKRLALLQLGASDGFISLAWLIFFAVASWLLWLLLLDVTPETPFTLANARRLRGLGVLVLGLNLAQELGYLAVRGLVPAFRAPGLAEPLNHYVRLNTEHTLPGWEVGLMFLIIAAIYERGVQLSREAELVI